MAQASSVQREPSMEEILASIRRIIEDSDGGRKAVDPGSPPVVDTAESAPSKADVESFRTELGTGAAPAFERKPPAPQPIAAPAAARPAPSPVAEFTPKPFRLADVQAQVARESAAAKPAETRPQPVASADLDQEIAADLEHEMAGGGAWQPATTTVPAAKPAPAGTGPAPRPVEQQASTDAPRHSASSSPQQSLQSVVSALKREEKPAAATTRAAQTPTPAQAAPVDGPSPAATPVPSAMPAAQRQSIISAAAGRQVAAAFGELSDAFAARSKKTFDELAEQMLRPMLQEWLDNNLPLLVEKLVREEIERVARGS
jgi:cell pole-organizing protein PopZ